MRRWLTAPILALVLAMGLVLPGAAQECADFASQKEAQASLELNGETGDLDLDQNGLACEQTLYGENQLAVNVDGPVTSDDETGESGATTVTVAPGAESQLADDGSGNDAVEEEAAAEEVAEEPAVTNEGDTETAAAGDAAATDSPEGETAAAGDAVAVDTDDADVEKPEKEKPEPEKPIIAPAPEEPAAPEAPVEEAPAPAPAVPATTLPSTGVGTTVAGTTGLALVALVGLALAFALAAVRSGRRV